jgi:hypothetical protein
MVGNPQRLPRGLNGAGPGTSGGQPLGQRIAKIGPEPVSRKSALSPCVVCLWGLLDQIKVPATARRATVDCPGGRGLDLVRCRGSIAFGSPWENSGEPMADDSEDGRWLSYAELAQARSIDVRSAIRTVRNRRWPKQKGNDGKIRVLVPTEFLEAKRYDRPEIQPEVTREISRLEARVEFLTEQLNHERGRADSAEAQLTDMRVREGAAQARADELRAVMDRLTAWPGAGAWARLRELWQSRRVRELPRNG